MVALSEIPLNSIVWSMGSLACYMLGYRSYASYRVSRNELSKYLAWFGVLMGTGQLMLAFPAFFVSDVSTLRITYLMGEFFVYASAVAQAAILWCLLLRSRIPRIYVLLPTILLGTASWLYAIPRSTLKFTAANNFIEYRDPLLSTIVVGLFLTGLFIPVGLYFLRSASRQEGVKAILTSLTLGLVYIGVGFFTGGIELLTGQVITPRSAIFDLAFFFVMFSVLLWPRPEPAKAPAAHRT